MPIPKTYKTQEAADYLGISRDSLETLATRGLVPRFKLGGLWHYCESDLDEYFRQQHQNGLTMAAQLRGDKKRPINIRSCRRVPTIEEVIRCWK